MGAVLMLTFISLLYLFARYDFSKKTMFAISVTAIALLAAIVAILRIKFGIVL